MEFIVACRGSQVRSVELVEHSNPSMHPGCRTTGDDWRYSNDDDTLFLLIALSTVELQKQGYTRRGSEAVVGPMAPFGETIKTDDDLWKIIAWIRLVHRGRRVGGC